MKKRLFSIILTLALCLSLLPTAALAAEAENGISVQAQNKVEISTDDINTEDGSINYGGGIARGDIKLTADEAQKGLSNRYYVVNQSMTIAGNLTVDCDKDGGLVLGDGVTLTIEGALIANGSDNPNISANKFYIYGQTGSSGKTGRLVIENSKSVGAAIRSTNQYAPKIGVSSGVLEIHGGTSKKLVEGVKLYSPKPMHKGTLNGTVVSPSEWGNSSITGTSLVLEYCMHGGDFTYTPDGDAQHKKTCKQCGFVFPSENCNFNSGWGKTDATGHYGKCYCGNVATTATAHDMITTWTDDGLYHTQSCRVCGYAPANGEKTQHSYNSDGECTVCQFKPVAKVAKAAQDNLYNSIDEALNEAVTHNDPTVTLETRATAGEDKTIDSSVSFDYADKSVELAMNGYTLRNSYGNATITVENGTLTITGDANIIQNGTNESAGYAVEATGGTLDMQGKVTLTGGLKVSGSATLATKLKAGDVLNGGVSVEGSSYANVNALLGENLAFANAGGEIVNGNVTSISGNVTVVEHTQHNYSSADGKCACGAECPHSSIDDATGKCAACEKTFLAVVNDTRFSTSMASAISFWVTKGGTMKLYADAGLNAVNFTAASADKAYTIDLNGHRINYTDYNSESTSINLNGVNLTIQDTKKPSNGTFGPIVADSGSLTLYNGTLKGLTIPADSTATVSLQGGKVSAINSAKPIYTLMPNGYALMNSGLTVDPAESLSGTDGYTIKNAQLTDKNTTTTGSTAFGSQTIPFTLSLKTEDTEIGRMSFKWYRIDSTSKAATLLARSQDDIFPVNGVYTFNANDVTINATGWDGMTPGKYEVICVVTSKTSSAAHQWQTALTGYKLTVTPASIEDAKVEVSGDLTYDGTTKEPTVIVKLGEKELVKGTDYTISGNTATNAGTHQLTINGIGNYNGSKETSWSIAPKVVSATVTVNGGPFTYTGSEIRPTVTVKEGTATIPESEYTVSYSGNINAGTATVTITDKAGGNYTVSGSTTFEIGKAASAVTAAPKANTLTYNGGAQALVAAGTANGGTMQYSLDGTNYSADIPKAKNAGTYTVHYRVAGDSNHNNTTAQSVNVTIGKAPVTVMAKDKSAYVGSEAPALAAEPVKDTDYTVSGLFGTDTLKGNVTLTYKDTPDMTKTGETAIRISGTLANDNYVVSYVDGKLTVTNKPSSGGSSKPSYSVNTPSKTENGSVSLSTKNATKGSTVTVTVQPESGYVLEKLTVTDKNGKELTLTDKGNGKYSFVMPAGAVEIKASFTEEVKAPAFADVSEDAYYYEPVQWALERGITDGISEDLFGPNQPCTRGQIVTFLWRAAGSPEPKGTSSFADVPAESYYAKAVAWAVENGITNGTGEGTFSPDAPCDRAQSVTLLFRALGGETESSTDFSDVPAGSYYASAVAWAAEQGITTGTSSTTFSPNDTCTRGQIVTFLYRTYQGK